MLSLGLSSVLRGTSENIDSVKFINNVYHLVKRHLSADASYRELVDRQANILSLFCLWCHNCVEAEYIICIIN